MIVTSSLFLPPSEPFFSPHSRRRLIAIPSQPVAGLVIGLICQGGEIYKSWLNATGWSAAGDLEIAARMRLRGGAGFDFTAPASYMNGKWILTAGKVKAVPED